MRIVREAATLIVILAGTAGALAQVTPEQQSAIRSNCRSDFMSKCSGVTPGGKDALQCLQTNVATLSAGCQAAVTPTLPKPAPAAQAPAPAAVAPAATVAPAAAAPAPSTPVVVAPAAPAPTAAAPVAAPKATAAKPVAAAKPAAKPAPKPAAKPEAAAAKPAANPDDVTEDDVATGPTPEQLGALKFTCRRELSAHCNGMAADVGAIACLQEHQAQLSADCQTSVADVAESLPAVPPASPMPPPNTARNRAPVANAAVMLRACKRDLVRHCRDVAPGDGRELACLAAHEKELTIRCKMARRVTAPLR